MRRIARAPRKLLLGALLCVAALSIALYLWIARTPSRPPVLQSVPGLHAANETERRRAAEGLGIQPNWMTVSLAELDRNPEQHLRQVARGSLKACSESLLPEYVLAAEALLSSLSDQGAKYGPDTMWWRMSALGWIDTEVARSDMPSRAALACVLPLQSWKHVELTMPFLVRLCSDGDPLVRDAARAAAGVAAGVYLSEHGATRGELDHIWDAEKVHSALRRLVGGTAPVGVWIGCRLLSIIPSPRSDLQLLLMRRLSDFSKNDPAVLDGQAVVEALRANLPDTQGQDPILEEIVRGLDGDHRLDFEILRLGALRLGSVRLQSVVQATAMERYYALLEGHSATVQMGLFEVVAKLRVQHIDGVAEAAARELLRRAQEDRDAVVSELTRVLSGTSTPEAGDVVARSWAAWILASLGVDRDTHLRLLAKGIANHGHERLAHGLLMMSTPFNVDQEMIHLLSKSTPEEVWYDPSSLQFALEITAQSSGQGDRRLLGAVLVAATAARDVAGLRAAFCRLFNARFPQDTRVWAPFIVGTMPVEDPLTAFHVDWARTQLR